MTGKTKTIIMVVLLVANIAMAYWLYNIINKDVREKAKIEEIDAQVIQKLKEVRDCQVAFRQANGRFAGSFDELIGWMKTGYVLEFKKTGDKDKDPNAIVTLDTIRREAMSYVFGEQAYDIDRLGLVPPHDTATFTLDTGYIVKNDVRLPTFQVEDPHPYNKDRTLKVGDLFDAVEDGNWK